MFFILCLLLFTEFNTRGSRSNAAVQFRRGSKAAVIKEAAKAVGSDEEKKAVSQEATITDENGGGGEGQEKRKEVLREQPKMVNTFSWQHIDYVIPMSGGKKQKLLDDVSGFVSPGKLTALMGESGAGKVCVLLQPKPRRGTLMKCRRHF